MVTHVRHSGATASSRSKGSRQCNALYAIVLDTTGTTIDDYSNNAVGYGDINNRVFAIYLIMMVWKRYEYYYETVELPNPRPALPKKK